MKIIVLILLAGFEDMIMHSINITDQLEHSWCVVNDVVINHFEVDLCFSEMDNDYSCNNYLSCLELLQKCCPSVS